MTVSYEVSVRPHYEEIIFKHLSREDSRPPEGWSWVQLTLPICPKLIEVSQQDAFMGELLKMIRGRTSTTNPKNITPQGLWIEDFGSSLILDEYLRGGALKIFAGEPVIERDAHVWIQVSA
jgi:hypothetical protein